MNRINNLNKGDTASVISVKDLNVFFKLEQAGCSTGSKFIVESVSPVIIKSKTSLISLSEDEVETIIIKKEK